MLQPRAALKRELDLPGQLSAQPQLRKKLAAIDEERPYDQWPELPKHRTIRRRIRSRPERGAKWRSIDLRRVDRGDGASPHNCRAGVAKRFRARAANGRRNDAPRHSFDRR